MNGNNYTSLELSEKLAKAGCDKKLAETVGKLESEYCWIYSKEYNEIILVSKKDIYSWKYELDIEDAIENKKVEKIAPAYDILNDICVKYAEEFFGEEYKYHSKKILQLFQESRLLEIEDYIWKNCKFNKNNK